MKHFQIQTKSPLATLVALIVISRSSQLVSCLLRNQNATALLPDDSNDLSPLNKSAVCARYIPPSRREVKYEEPTPIVFVGRKKEHLGGRNTIDDHHKYKEMDDTYSVSQQVRGSHAADHKDMYTQPYFSIDEMKSARGPNVNQELCLKQLTELNTRARQMEIERWLSRDVTLFRLLETFGRPTSTELMGNGLFIGGYYVCLRAGIKLASDSVSTIETNYSQLAPPVSISTRYCVVTLKRKEEPHVGRTSAKVGICLPDRCDSLDYKNKYELVMDLYKTHMSILVDNQFGIQSLYCLPDDNSPSRSILNSLSLTSITLLCLVGWVSLLIFATYKCDHELEQKPQRRQLEATDDCTDQHETNGGETDRLRVYRMLSIKDNLKILFDNTTDKSTVGGGSPKIVDLRPLDGMKVLILAYAITGHVLMCVSTFASNKLEMADTGSLAFSMAKLAPAAASSFFTVVGILNGYLLLRRSRLDDGRPINWLALIGKRYLRMVPIYALVVLYTKTLAKYSGSGPLWDYGTSSFGQRRTCELESWSGVFLLGSSSTPTFEQCVPSAWYLVNEFRFLLITPIFFGLLDWKPKLGRRLLMGYAATSLLYNFYNSFTPDDAKNTLALGTFISQFSTDYTRSQYRLPAYLIGLLVGYELFEYERNKVERQNSEEAKNCEAREPSLPGWLKSHATQASLLLTVLVCSATYVAIHPSPDAKFKDILTTSLSHVLFPLAVALYLTMATTSQGNKLLNNVLSKSLWRPLSRLTLCVLLVNVEVINYIIQSNKSMPYLSNQYHMTLNISSILASYSAAAVVWVLFESPIRRILNSWLDQMTSKLKPPLELYPM